MQEIEQQNTIQNLQAVGHCRTHTISSGYQMFEFLYVHFFNEFHQRTTVLLDALNSYHCRNVHSPDEIILRSYGHVGLKHISLGTNSRHSGSIL